MQPKNLLACPNITSNIIIFIFRINSCKTAQQFCALLQGAFKVDALPRRELESALLSKEHAPISVPSRRECAPK